MTAPAVMRVEFKVLVLFLCNFGKCDDVNGIPWQNFQAPFVPSLGPLPSAIEMINSLPTGLLLPDGAELSFV